MSYLHLGNYCLCSFVCMWKTVCVCVCVYVKEREGCFLSLATLTMAVTLVLENTFIAVPFLIS